MNTTTNANTGGGGIQRDTSVRSIITLPAYSSSPKPTEQIIAREGERAGMDVVVEFPETAEEEESRREDLMESLYQVRLQRREENARRRARRDARREARANGDAARLEQLRMESQRRRDRSGTDSSHQSVSTRLREHRERSQDGRTSRVNYGELGCVRHDGSRVRANSAESDSRPLLDASAPMSGHHARGDSVSSFVSGSTVSLGDTVTPIPSHPHSVRQSMSGDGDVGALNIPPPPDYEHLDWGDAPAYERREREPDSSQHLQLPEFTPLPAIQIDMASPVSDSPVSPMHLGRAAHEHRTSDSPGSSSPSTPDNAQPEPEGGHSDVPTTSSGNDSATPGPHPQREHEPSTGNSPTSPATATATAPTAQTEHGHQPQSSNASGST